jgi:hypothetical protein
MKNLLFGFVADGARVVKDQSRFLYCFHLAISLMDQRADDLLRVMHIHLAAKSFQVKRLFLLCAHSSSITQQNSGVSGYSLVSLTTKHAKVAKN